MSSSHSGSDVLLEVKRNILQSSPKFTSTFLIFSNLPFEAGYSLEGLQPRSLHGVPPARRETGGMAAIKNWLVTALALFACKYMNHKLWKLNPENSPDSDSITVSIWLLRTLSNVLSASSQNPAHNAEAIPAIWKHWLNYCREDFSRKGACGPQHFIREPFWFLST